MCSSPRARTATARADVSSSSSRTTSAWTTRRCRSTTSHAARSRLASVVVTLSGKTAIVTGASSGFGRSTARMLAEAGVRVAGGARRVERLETDVALELDVTDPASCERFRSEEHTSELQSLTNLVCRLLLEKKKKNTTNTR